MPWSPPDPKGVSRKEPKTSKPVFSTGDTELLRECIIFYLNKNDFILEANTIANFTPTEDNKRKRETLLNLIHRLGRLK